MNQKVKELVAQMTLEEKAGMCSGFDFWHLKGVDRLSIPKVMVSDGPHGLRKQDLEGDHLGINDSIKAVCFPPACLSACSFDRTLIHEMGVTIGKEAQAEDVSVILGPAVNMKRSPLCGRNFEYYSEDPFLSGEIAAAFINGVQSQGIGTSIKHFAANNQEYNRMSASSEVDERTLREIYLPSFETAVKKANPQTVMCSYNQLNGIYASEHPWLLTDVLRKEWGFKGYVMSDWGAVNDRVEGLKAGLELEMPTSNGMNDAQIIEAVNANTLDLAVLDQAVERILTITYQYLDQKKEEIFDLEKDHQVAKHIAEESMVLLKNQGVLPLKKEATIAFIGEFAKKPRFQGGGSSHINSFKVTNAYDSAKSLINDPSCLLYAKGFSTTEDQYDRELAKEAIDLAKTADVTVIFAGLPDSFESEGYDRSHMRLPDCQNRLIAELAQVTSNTVVVLHNGSPVEMPWLSQVSGLLEAYLGGQAVGEAVTSILFGEVNPSGKLAETFPKKLQDNPSYLNFGDESKVTYHEGVFIGYRYYDTKEMEVAFPFGFGLSYTNYTYSNLKVSQSYIKDTDELIVSVDVTNTGELDGKEILQLYVRDLTNEVKRPTKELKGFEKITLAAKETKTITFTLNKRSFAYYNETIGDWHAASGTYQILIGSSSAHILLAQEITLESTVKLPLILGLNSTLGDLFKDERSRAFGETLKQAMGAFFGTEDNKEASEAISDSMVDAMALSMPLRTFIAFGMFDKDELIKKLEELS